MLDDHNHHHESSSSSDYNHFVVSVYGYTYYKEWTIRSTSGYENIKGNEKRNEMKMNNNHEKMSTTFEGYQNMVHANDWTNVVVSLSDIEH